MKKLIALLSSVALACLFASAVHAADAQATEAKVVKVTGPATVTLPGQTEAVALTVGMSLPSGAVITTGAGGEVDIQPMAGTLTAVRANTSVSLDELSVTKNSAGVVTKQTAQLGLKSGNVVSTLDPGRKAINNYGIRTPKGVAAARGTTYGVGVSVTDGESVATMAGTVTFTTADGVAYVVDIGTGMVISAGGVAPSAPVSLATLVADEAAAGTAGDENSITSAITAAVATVSAAVQNNTIGLSADGAATALAAVVKVATQANPTAAATYTSQAVAAVTAPGSATAGNASAAAQAVTEAATQGAVTAVVKSGGDAAAVQSVTDKITTAATDSINSNSSVTKTDVLGAAAAGAATATQNNQDLTPTVTTPATSPNSSPTVVPPAASTPITPVDVTAISPSGGTQ